MIITENGVPVEMTGSKKTTQMGIALTGKLFKMFNKGIYSDIKGSIVREVSCNGVDSHIAAGKAHEPIIIHLPDDFESYFAVIDNGVGMSPETVENIYGNYGKSTKDQSNEEVGAFGVGGKSPLAYTDMYTLISRYNGVMSTYSIFYNVEGIPEVNLMSTVEGDFENGVEVQVPVQLEDYSVFAEKVKQQLRFFKVKPTIINGEIEFPKMTPIFEENGVTICNDVRGAYVLQGGVGYPLNVNELTQDVMNEVAIEMGLEPSVLRNYLNKLASIGTLIEFKIGEIDVPASREQIQYGESTVRNICNRFGKVIPLIKAKIESELAHCSTLYERCQYMNSSSDIHALVNLLEIKVDGLLRRGSIYGISFDGSDYPFVEYFKEPAKDINGVEMLNTDGTPVMHDRYTRHATPYTVRIRHNGLPDYESMNNLFLTGKNTVLIRDTGKRPRDRMMEYCNKNALHEVAMITPEDRSDAAVSKLIKHFVDKMGAGECHFVRLSTVEPPARTVKSYTRATYFVANNRLSSTTTNWTKVTDGDLDDAYENADAIYYLPFSRRSVEFGAASAMSMETYIKEHNIDYKNVIALRDADIEKLVDDPRYVSLSAKAIEYANKFKSYAQDRLALKMLLNNISYDLCYTHGSKFINAMAERGPVFKRVKRIQNLLTRFTKSFDKVEERANVLGIAHPRFGYIPAKYTTLMNEAAELKKEWGTEIINITARYPLLSVISTRYMEEDKLNKVIEYMDVWDKNLAEQGSSASTDAEIVVDIAA